MATLELSREEATDLADALRSYLNDFHDEIVNTDDFDYKQALQRKRERLEGVVARLAGNGPSSGGEVIRPVDGGDQTLIREVPPSPGGGTGF